MKIHRFSIMAGALLLGTMASTLQAKDPAGWQAGASLLGSFEASRQQAGLDYGFGGWLGYGIQSSVGDVVIRPSFALNYIMGDSVEGVVADADARAAAFQPYKVRGSAIQHNMYNMQVGLDALVPIFDKKAHLLIGLSANKYMFDVSGASAGVYSPVDIDAANREPVDAGFLRSGNANGKHYVKGVKLGVRFGVEYHLSDVMDLRLMAQQTEMGRSDNKPSQMPTLQPFWVDFGVSFRF